MSILKKTSGQSSTPSAGYDALWVNVLGCRPPVDRLHIHAAASLCTCGVC